MHIYKGKKYHALNSTINCSFRAESCSGYSFEHIQAVDIIQAADIPGELKKWMRMSVIYQYILVVLTYFDYLDLFWYVKRYACISY